jgi:hemolysin III
MLHGPHGNPAQASARTATAMHEEYTFHEEIANAITHAIGTGMSLVGGAVLIILAATRADAWLVVSSAIFVVTLVLLYTASTLYHCVRTPHLRWRFKVLDHCAIYLLIAGTYTPFMLGTVRGGWGWTLFAVVWTLAVAGVVFKLFFTGRFPRLSTGIYIGMGWLVLVAIGPLLRELSGATLLWLLAGGLTYTAGTIFYHRPQPFAHAVWHVFVLAGSICHGVAVATLVL